MGRISNPRILLLLALLTLLLPAGAVAQDDPNDRPLGDVARNYRRKTPSSQQVLDNDNFSQALDEAQSKRAAGSALRFLMSGESKGFQVSAPDVTCSLSFSVNAKSLLSSQYAQMDLPASDVLKLEGPAVLEGDALQVSVFNATEWHVSEVTVALTIVKKKSVPADIVGGLPMQPAAEASTLEGSEVRPEKKPDVTVIYRMRAAAPPFATTVFSAPLERELAPGEEWHWAIVQARGYPPQTYSAAATQTPVQPGPAAAKPAAPSSLSLPLYEEPEPPTQSQR